MISPFGPVVLPLPLLFAFLLVSLCVAQPPPKFRCSSNSNCQALAGYVPPRETTYEAIRGLFDVDSIYDLYGANGLDETIPASTKVPANATVRIRFACSCGNGTGISNRRPIYAVKDGDSLKAIASEIFGGLVTYQQIAAANGIENASLIKAGQRLFIPLPCSCDEVSIYTIHLAHVVKQRSSLEDVSSEFDVSQASLTSLNNISDPKNLIAGQVLDVPLSACFSSLIRPNSSDYGLLVPNGSYALTAGSCIKCMCQGPSLELWCVKAPDLVLNRTSRCNQRPCDSSDHSFFEHQLHYSYFSSCGMTLCVYAGFDNGKILTTTITDHDCGRSAKLEFLLRWPLLLLLLLFVVL